MFPSSSDYKAVIDRPIRPSTQVIVREYTDTDFSVDDLAIYVNIDRELIGGYPNLEPIRDNTYYATFAANGYCVGDNNLRCVPDEKIINSDVMPISKFNATSNTWINLFRVDNLSENQDVYITVQPTYSSTVDVFVMGHNSSGWGERTYQTITNKTEPTTLHFVTDNSYSYLAIGFRTNSENSRFSMYPPSASETQEHRILFDNHNLTSVSYQKSTDLYVQDEFNYTFEVTALDLEKLFDPANPQGIYNNFTEYYRVLVNIGYEIEDGRYEFPLRQTMYLAERPSYEGNKVTCKFGLLPWVAKIRNNNLIKPIFGKREDGTFTNNLFYVLGTTYIYPPNYEKTFVTRIMKLKTDCETDDYATNGYTSATEMKDIYKLLTNATGMYISEGFYSNISSKYGYTTEDFNEQLRQYFSGEIEEVNHFTRNDIVDFSLNILPQLKTLSINKYNYEMNDSIIQTITGISINKSQFVDLGDGNSQAEITLDIEDNLQASSCTCKNISGANIGWWTLRTVVNGDTGIPYTNLRIRVTTSSLSNIVTLDVDLYGLNQSVKTINNTINETGEDMEIDNPYITSDKLVEIATNTIKAIAECREQYTLKVIQDVRLQLGDIITIDTPYEEEVPCIITGLKFTFPAITGEVICRRLHYDLDNA